MLIRAVVRDQIENDSQALRVGSLQQGIEVAQAPEQRVYVGVVGNVIAEIHHGRRKDRRKPERIDSELDQIRQTLQDATQITDAVAIAVLERPRIDLVDHAGLPPKCTLHDVLQVEARG
jgi:hypothetical protein